MIPLLLACTPETPPPGDAGPLLRLADTLVLGPADNIEAVRLLPQGGALALGSKAHVLHRLGIDGDALSLEASASLPTASEPESELTHLAISPDGAWAAVSRTVVERSGVAVVSCGGEVLTVSLDEPFGAVLGRVAVGPMPDAVALSPDGRTLAVANERDVVWGKCEEAADVAPGSVSLVDLSDPTNPVELERIEAGGDREPEALAWVEDGVLLVTLQDSHEVLRIEGGATSAASLSPDALGRDGWPDGIASIDGVALAAGEANDVLYVLDGAGVEQVALPIDPGFVPADLPRDGSWGPLFRPDSVAAFRWGEHSLAAVTLKASGAVALVDLTEPTDPALLQVVAVGRDETAGADEESVILPEGVDGREGLVLTANEGESSVSLLVAL